MRHGATSAAADQVSATVRQASTSDQDLALGAGAHSPVFGPPHSAGESAPLPYTTPHTPRVHRLHPGTLYLASSVVTTYGTFPRSPYRRVTEDILLVFLVLEPYVWYYNYGYDGQSWPLASTAHGGVPIYGTKRG